MAIDFEASSRRNWHQKELHRMQEALLGRHQKVANHFKELQASIRTQKKYF
jgi:hypothetical protein